MSSTPDSLPSLCFRAGPSTGCFIEGESLLLQGHMAWLKGPAVEVLVRGETIARVPGGVILTGPDTLAGVLTAHGQRGLKTATHDLYARLLDLTDGWHLHRIWNLVPHINDAPAGMENYRAFNAGRHRVLSERWHSGLASRLPAASALGTQSGGPALAFSAARRPAQHFENPLQEAPLSYPPEFGPLPPAFARSSKVTIVGGTVWHLSGTASIRGCRTVGAGINEQLAVTLENIATLYARMEVPAGRRATWKIFLRDPAHLDAASTAFTAAWPDDAASAMYLHADICRPDLLVEIEAIFSA
jgi:chorismate lyase/3-hydroxybenzoate synthase